jgi:hypothetical protein
MSFYGFLRLAIVPLAITGWVIYQLFVMKKRFEDFEGDFYIALFVVGVYVALIYWINN